MKKKVLQPGQLAFEANKDNPEYRLMQWALLSNSDQRFWQTVERTCQKKLLNEIKRLMALRGRCYVLGCFEAANHVVELVSPVRDKKRILCDEHFRQHKQKARKKR